MPQALELTVVLLPVRPAQPKSGGLVQKSSKIVCLLGSTTLFAILAAKKSMAQQARVCWSRG